MDLVRATAERTAEAVLGEYRSFAAAAPGVLPKLLGSRVSVEWIERDSLGSALALVDRFDAHITRTLVLPTRGEWTVLWHNSLLCDGYDSLCVCLSRFRGLTTIHWSASDSITTVQAGAMFHLREPTPQGVRERRVQAAQEDRRWRFFEMGDPLPEEDVEGYAARRIRDRLNETRLAALLRRLGAEPWNEDSYAFPGKVAMISRPLPGPARSTVRLRSEVLRPRAAPEPR